MRYLLDSDWIIDALAGIPTATEPINRLSDHGIAVSMVAVGELYEGAYGAPNPEAHLTAVRRFLSPFPIITLTEPIMALFARERARLRREGNLIPDFDLLMAATALLYDLILLTRNRRHFTAERFPQLKLYQPATP